MLASQGSKSLSAASPPPPACLSELVAPQDQGPKYLTGSSSDNGSGSSSDSDSDSSIQNDSDSDTSDDIAIYVGAALKLRRAKDALAAAKAAGGDLQQIAAAELGLIKATEAEIKEAEVAAAVASARSPQPPVSFSSSASPPSPPVSLDEAFKVRQVRRSITPQLSPGIFTGASRRRYRHQEGEGSAEYRYDSAGGLLPVPHTPTTTMPSPSANTDASCNHQRDATTIPSPLLPRQVPATSTALDADPTVDGAGHDLAAASLVEIICTLGAGYTPSKADAKVLKLRTCQGFCITCGHRCNPSAKQHGVRRPCSECTPLMNGDCKTQECSKIDPVENNGKDASGSGGGAADVDAGSGAGVDANANAATAATAAGSSWCRPIKNNVGTGDCPCPFHRTTAERAVARLREWCRKDESWSMESTRQVFEAIARLHAAAAADVAATPAASLERLWWGGESCPCPSPNLAKLLGALKPSKADHAAAKASRVQHQAGGSASDMQAPGIAAASTACAALGRGGDTGGDSDSDDGFFNIYGEKILTAAEEDAASKNEEARRMQVAYHTLDRRLFPLAIEWRMRKERLDNRMTQIVLPAVHVAPSSGAAAPPPSLSAAASLRSLSSFEGAESVCTRGGRLFNARKIAPRSTSASTTVSAASIARHRLSFLMKARKSEGVKETTVEVELRTQMVLDVAPALIMAGNQSHLPSSSSAGKGKGKGHIQVVKKRDKKTERSIAAGKQGTLNMFFSAMPIATVSKRSEQTKHVLQRSTTSGGGVVARSGPAPGAVQKEAKPKQRIDQFFRPQSK